MIPPARNPTRYRLFGGKGGVGKTTCAAGAAIAEAMAGARTLVISTDPAPSLGDALGRRLTSAPRSLALATNRRLYAAEIDAARALDRWLAERRAALERVVLRGTWFDEEDVARLLRLSLPGIDEIAALLELLRLGRSGLYDLIVIDTAPTGHTLRMLAMPDTLLGVAQLFERMQHKHRVMLEALRGAWQPDRDDRLIDGMMQDARGLAELLRDRARVTMSWVTLAEPMAVEETMDALEELAAQGLAFTDIVLNRLTPEPPAPCRWCGARRAFEAQAGGMLRRRIGRAAAVPVLRQVLARETEPTGVRALASIGRGLTDARAADRGSGLDGRRSGAARRTAGARTAPMMLARADTGTAKALASGWLVPQAGSRSSGASLVLFGGKGGVGKTTCAAAAALAMAAANPRRRVLLISTDPAHSLSDALGVPLADAPRTLPGGPPNLSARELDAAAAYAAVRDRYRMAIDALFDRFSRTSGLDPGYDRRVMHDLIDLAPPGVDELAAVIEVVDALGDRSGADVVVLDTAPTGHALRLLEMPALVQAWSRALMAILLKYQPVVGLGDLGAVLLKLSQGTGRLRALLGDRERTRFVVVTRPAALPRAESGRLLGRLARLGIHAPTVIVNAVGAGECPRCRRQCARESREIARLERDLRASRRRVDVVVALASMPPPHGRAALRRWRRAWRALP